PRTSTSCASRSTRAPRWRWRWSPHSHRTTVQGANRPQSTAEGRGMRRLIVLACLTALAAIPAGAAAADNPADRYARQPIDPYQYDYAKKCLKREQKVTLELERWRGHNTGDFPRDHLRYM